MLSLLLPERCSVIKYDQVSLLSPFPPGYLFFPKAFHNKGGKNKRGRKSPASSSFLCRALVWMLWWDRTLLDPPLPIPPSLLTGMRNNLFFGSNRSSGRNPPPPSGRVGKNLDGFCAILSGSQGDTRTGFLHWGGCWALLEFPFLPFFFYPAASVPCRKLLAAEPCHGKVG